MGARERSNASFKANSSDAYARTKRSRVMNFSSLYWEFQGSVL